MSGRDTVDIELHEGRGMQLDTRLHGQEDVAQIEREFYAENGYTWDWVMVFKLLDNKCVAPSTITVIKTMVHAGLTVATEFDHDGTLLFVKIAASIKRLEQHADAIDFHMRADSYTLQAIANEGVPLQAGLERGIEKFQIGHDPKLSKYTPYEHIFLPYEQTAPKRDWFKQQPGTTSPFSQCDRIKLIKSILISDFVAGDETCGLNVRGMIAGGAMDACFPMHDRAAADELVKKWVGACCAFPWSMPLDTIRLYLGEKITLYFAFVGHYATWLHIPALTGIIPFVIMSMGNFEEDVYAHPIVGIYGMLIAIWAIFMLEFWKRRQKKLALQWGMIGFESKEQERPEYKGEMRMSLASDKPSKQYPMFYYRLKMGTSVGIIFIAVCVVVAAVAAIFVFRYFLESNNGGSYAATVASIMNSIQIIVLNALYSELALWLSKWENHRTDTMYQDALIAKLFAFQFVNSYASMVYIAFIQPFEGDYPCKGGNCIGLLGNNLTTIIITRIISSNMTGVVVPMMKDWWKRRQEEKKEGHAMTELEVQFKMSSYNPILDLIGDYANIAINYGYAILFVVSNPIVPLLVLFSNYVEIRGDGFKLLRVMRRPEPGGVEDIGTWQSVFTFITYMSVVSNAALICFTANVPKDSTLSATWIFYILQVGGFGLAALCAELIPDVPADVEIQIERNEFWVEKLIEQVVEEQEEVQEARDRTSVESKLPDGWRMGVESPKAGKGLKYIKKAEERGNKAVSAV